MKMTVWRCATRHDEDATHTNPTDTSRSPSHTTTRTTARSTTVSIADGWLLSRLQFRRRCRSSSPIPGGNRSRDANTPMTSKFRIGISEHYFPCECFLTYPILVQSQALRNPSRQKHFVRLPLSARPHRELYARHRVRQRPRAQRRKSGQLALNIYFLNCVCLLYRFYIGAI